MGIVAYYVDVDAAQLAALRATPALVWQIQSDPRFANASRIDVDKDWETLSWLASPKKRIEKCHESAWMKVNMQDASKNTSQEEFKAMVAKAVEALGCSKESKASDPFLSAIEGRGSQAERDPALNFGLGAARLFQPVEVKQLAVSFSKFDVSALGRQFNRKEMARFDVGGMDWETESDRVLDDFLVPSFQKISNFYQRAAKLKHYVLVIYQ